MSKMSLGVQKVAAAPHALEEPSTEPRSLQVLANGTRMLAEARTLEDLKQVRDAAVAAQAYARAHQLGTEAQKYAGEIAIRAETRMGAAITTGQAEGTIARQGAHVTGDNMRGLPELGITRPQSHHAQTLAAYSDQVETYLTGAAVPTISRARRTARDADAKARRMSAPEPVLPLNCDLRQGDFREVLADVPAKSLDIILTDPPYPEEFLPLWSDLGAFAAEKLKPQGILAAMSGQVWLPEVIHRLGEHMTYRWTMAYMLPGVTAGVQGRRIQAFRWKPVLIYGSNSRWISTDVAVSEGGDKSFHDWGQSESGMADLLRILAEPGQIVCDPFAGGGTTAVVALRFGCPFIGAELDADHYEQARRRIAA